MGSVSQQPEMRGFDSFEVRLGDELRGERATLGKSLLDVQRELRIKAAYIAAIENCDVDVFPNKGFIAGYVRSYARYMNLDPDDVFRRFCVEANFGGVNAGLSAPKRSNSGRIVSSGPVRATKDDPILKPLRPAPELSPSLSERVSLSAVGSFAVLVMLLGGLGFGALSFLHSIQRVDIAPVDQRPVTYSDVTGLSSPGYSTEVELNQPASEEPTNRDLTRLYEPRELALPILKSRDGPIVDIDPSQSRLVVQNTPAKPAPIYGPVRPAGLLVADNGAGEAADPQVREEVGVPQVNVIAQRPAWIRVYLDDGTILFEKILETGETYTLPEDLETPRLRAGNAGSVFLAVNDKAYGPVGSGTGVAKNVSLLPDDIAGAFEVVVDVPEVVQATVSALSMEDTMALPATE